MTSLLNDPGYKESVAKAESATADITDPALRQIAFGKILDHLLAEPDGSNSKASKPTSRPARRAAPDPASAKRSGPAAYLEELVDEGFFAQPRTLTEARAELSNRGHHIPSTSLSGPLQALCQRERLRRQRKSIDSGKEAFAYSNW
jgi:hypothetical protein